MGTKKRKPAPAKRTATEPLHVMLEPWMMKRYKKFHEELGVSMRTLVVSALEDYWFKNSAEGRAMDPANQMLPRVAQLPMDGVDVTADLTFNPPPISEFELGQLREQLSRVSSRLAKLEIETRRNRLRLSEHRGTWRHTHNASVNGQIVNLHAETHGPYLLLFERDAMHPTWSITSDGALDRLDGGEPGIVVAVS